MFRYWGKIAYCDISAPTLSPLSDYHCNIDWHFIHFLHRCTLRWEPSSDDGGADVRHYVLEYFRDVWNVWLKAKTTKECQVAVDDLIPGSR